MLFCFHYICWIFKMDFIIIYSASKINTVTAPKSLVTSDINWRAQECHCGEYWAELKEFAEAL